MYEYLFDRWGPKEWVLAECTTGYVYALEVYKGSRFEAAASEKGLGFDVVTRLLQPLYHKGHHVILDNFFTRYN